MSISEIQKIERFVGCHYKVERNYDWNKYHGFDQNTKEPVSFTIIYNLLESKFNIWRVLEEMQKNSEYKHENVVSLVNIKISNKINNFKSIVFVMERYDTNLLEIINGKQEISIDRRCFFMYQILQGLKYLHSGNIIHGYLRPDKIMIDRNNNLKIDAMNYDNHFYRHWYRSPESLMNRPNNKSFATDVWSAGCIFYELIERKPLFQGKNAMNQLLTIIKTIGSPNEDERDLKLVNNQKQIEYDVNWDKIIENGTNEEIELIQMMLKWNPSKRISIEKALKHPYFESLFNHTDDLLCSQIEVSNPERMAYDKLPKYFWNKIQEIRKKKNYK